MHIALDIDGTITAAPEFFATLTHGLASARVTIISFRDDEPEARALLFELGIRYDELVLMSHPEHGAQVDEGWEAWKAATVAKLGVDIFFEDMPEVVHLVQPPTKVVMVCGNEVRSWLSECLERV